LTLPPPPPLVSNAGPVPNYLVGGPAVAIGPNLSLSDAESTSLQSATVSIATGFLAGDILGFTGQPGVGGSYNAATGVLTLTGSVGAVARGESGGVRPVAAGASPKRTPASAGATWASQRPRRELQSRLVSVRKGVDLFQSVVIQGRRRESPMDVNDVDTGKPMSI
jgi:hypothetical protein